ncbi:unnamed protein product [Sphagnum jensenii]|uniref:Uncharacterized protein n=1 Tax=Sphagnum jensenii TaxID=128206 RepID=A0ABP0WG05_9BRYO
MKVRGVFFLFKDGFPKKNEGPGDVGAIGHLPFAPNTKEGIPGLLNRDAFHEIVLGGLRESLVTTLAGSLDSHDLEPGTYRQPVIKDQLGERPHLAWAGIMPHSGDDLGDRGVAKIQLLDEGDDVGSVLLPPGIPSERCSMAILGEDPDRHVLVKGDGDVMRAGSLDSTRVRGFFEFLGIGGVVCYIGDLIDPFRRGDPVSFLFADPVPYHRFVTGDGWVPWDAGYNEVPI